jgi:prolyl oligopeptidase
MKFYLTFLLIFVLNKQITFPQNIGNSRSWKYPIIKADTAIDFYFGRKIIDPYRNMENLELKPVKKWIKEQNKFYDNIIQNISNHRILKREFEKMENVQKKWVSLARVACDRIFYPGGNMNDKIERIFYVDSIGSNPIEIFNTKKFNKKNKSFYSIDFFEPSYDGKLLAFGVSPDGSERDVTYILDVGKKELLTDQIDRTMFGNIQWLPNNSGFFYIQNREDNSLVNGLTSYEEPKVKLHLLKSDVKYDKEIFSIAVNKKLGLEKIDLPMLFIFPSSDKVLINIQKGTELYYSIYYSSLSEILSKPAEDIQWIKICDTFEKINSNVLYGDKFFGLSYKLNPNGQIITMDLPDLTPKTLFEGKNFLLEDMVLNQNWLYTSCLENGISRLVGTDLVYNKTDFIQLPFYGGISLRPSFGVVSYYQHSNNLLFCLVAFNKQWDMYQLNIENKIKKTNFAPEVQYFIPQLNLDIEEIQIKSHDSALVPMSIIYKKGIILDGKNPTIIEAYGAYGISEKPTFDRELLIWYKCGGIYAVAHVRGGGEKGDSWYKAGLKKTKPNSWKDLIACAEYLIKNNYTSPKNLALVGASAGAITVGRAIIERPELFKASVIYSGTLNALRMENSINRNSVTEFGTVKDSIEFGYLYNMDVYQNLHENINYPSILFATGINDSRVSPWEVTKTAAKMQHLSKGENLILLNFGNMGHFNYPTSQDIYSFLFWQLGHPDFKLKEISYFYK